MSVLKYYDSSSHTWVPALYGSQGPVSSLPVFTLAGTVSVVNGSTRLYMDRNGTITTVRVGLGTAPVGASLIVTLNKNGAPLQTVTVPSTSNTAVVTGLTHAVLANDYLTVSITQIGTTVAGSDLTVSVTII